MVNFFIGFQVPLDLDPFAFVIDGLAFIADQLASHIPVVGTLTHLIHQIDSPFVSPFAPPPIDAATNLDLSVTSAHLQGVFYKFGTILSCKVAEENVKSKVLGLSLPPLSLYLSLTRSTSLSKKNALKPSSSTAVKLHISFSPSRLVNRLVSPLKSMKTVQRSDDGLMICPDSTTMRFNARKVNLLFSLSMFAFTNFNDLNPHFFFYLR
ncbi:hypothetical protein TEA_003232 [Camellia sinensis var. sinensis]|uniref:Uncharacterized protein n=1 Tax=Camellia sinensis var. sinensis TaxID=542762 RepID=A0A4S4E4L1_CAMSN|nr:hypothetical protein TEA_003232 [Camellia sinensis var. sinensis]